MNTRMLRLCALALFALPAATFAASPLIMNCQTISQPGSYVVTRNLSSTGDCIVIASGFVTLDLAGFTISGNGSSVGIHEAPGTQFPGFRGVLIRNGNVTNFGDGIQFFVSDGVTVENVNASSNTNNGLILLNRAVVRSSRFDDNGNNGVTVSDGAMITSSTATRNGNVGFAAATGALIVNNIAINNQLSGISQDCPGAAIANTVSENGPTFTGPNLVQINGSCLSDHNSTL